MLKLIHAQGGYPKFISQGLNEKYLPVWLQKAGYDTYYTGKLFNAHTVENYHSPYPAGFTGSDFLLDPYTYSYLNSTYQRNQDPPVSYEGQHTSDIIAEKAYGFLNDGANGKKPFFLAIAPIAPHSNVVLGESFRMTAPIPADRHSHLFEGINVPRTDHFNPDEVKSPCWKDDTELILNSRVVLAGSRNYQSRIRSTLTTMIISTVLASRLSKPLMSS
jgi:arylsulfatase A-like enzyme